VYAGTSLARAADVHKALPQCLMHRFALDGDELARLCQSLGPTILIVDYESLRRLGGGPVPIAVSLSSLQVLVLSPVCDEEVYRTTLAAGCSGVLAEDAVKDTLKRVVTAMGEGELWYPRSVLSALARGTLGNMNNTQPKLTARELEILQLLGANQKNQAIADQLFISRETVRWHLRALYSKIGVSGRTQAREYAQTAVLRYPRVSHHTM
jgi:DNA-binding NarL/FixJ family response regulator